MNKGQFVAIVKIALIAIAAIIIAKKVPMLKTWLA